MKYYPVYLRMDGRRVLLIGAGDVAWQKIPALLESGAKVHVVSPEALPSIDALAHDHKLEWSQRTYQTADLDGAFLVIAATDDPILQQKVAAECRARKIWVNVVDVTPLCDFIAPAIVSQGDVQIAISTGGTAPALAKYLRRKFEPLLGAEFGELANLLQRYRPAILQLPKPRRQALWEAIINDEAIEGMKRDGLASIESRIQTLLNE
jgi:precorrin-2 dehydrogenase / sirohydrochlorin ferrochelatase